MQHLSYCQAPLQYGPGGIIETEKKVRTNSTDEYTQKSADLVKHLLQCHHNCQMQPAEIVSGRLTQSSQKKNSVTSSQLQVSSNQSSYDLHPFLSCIITLLTCDSSKYFQLETCCLNIETIFTEEYRRLNES